MAEDKIIEGNVGEMCELVDGMEGGHISQQEEDTGRVSDQSTEPRNQLEYVTPTEIDKMRHRGQGSRFDWERLSSMMQGPKCWKCYNWGTFFSCKNCGRHFHRECIFMVAGYPFPICDKPVEEICKAEWGSVNILKCGVCLVSEETRIQKLKDVRQEDLNDMLSLITKLIMTEYCGDLLEKFPLQGKNLMSTAKIMEKLDKKEYKTVEGYFADFQQIYYNLHMYYRCPKNKADGEATTVARTVLNVVTKELGSMIACFDCTRQRFGPNGRLLNQTEFHRVIKMPCKVPHVILWLQQKGFPYWPAKVLGFERKNRNTKTILYVLYFGERAVTRSFYFPSEEIKFRTHALDISLGARNSTRKLQESVTACNRYLENLSKSKFKLVIPPASEDFDGDLDALRDKMYPSFVEANDDK